MKIALKILSAFVMVLVVLGCLLVFFRKPVASSLIKKYFSKKNISIAFSLDELTLTELKISQIRLGQKSEIPQIHLTYSNPFFGFFLKSIQVTADQVDIPELIDISQKFSTDSDTKASPAAPDLKQYCDNYLDTAIDISLKNLRWHEVTLPLNLRLDHLPQKTQFHLEFSGETQQPQKAALVSLLSSKFNGSMDLVCEDRIQAQLHHLHLSLSQLKSEKPKLALPLLSIHVENGQLTLSPDRLFEVTFPLQLDVQMEWSEQKMSATTQGLSFKARGSLDNYLKSELSVSAGKTTLRAPQEYSFQKLNVSLVPQPTQDSIRGDYRISGIRVKNAAAQVLMQGLESGGKLEFEKSHASALFSVTDATGILSLRDIALKYFWDQSRFSLIFPDKKATIRLSPKIVDFIPKVKNHIVTAFGTLRLRGELKGTTNNIQGPLQLKGEKVYLNTEYGQFQNINFSQTLTSLPQIKTPPSQEISIEQVIAGPTIDNVLIRSQVLSLEKIKVEKLSLAYDGALVEATQFLINPLEPSLVGFKANIKNFNLQTVLQLGLKNTVTAGGKLAGHVNLQYKDKIPTIEGQLQAETRGWIRYRPPGQKPKAAIQSTDNPMDILQGYLYDFAYETLNIQIESDKKYDSIMILNTLGRNPQYVQGKPLKLNLKLEQNLLAAVQSMMLTYDLPNKLKEKLEGSEAP